jgi:hypothetical protein
MSKRPLFRRIKISTINDLISALRKVSFPEDEEVSAVDVVILKADIKHNCDALHEYVLSMLPAAEANPDRMIIINELRRDIFSVRSQCAKVSINFLRPRRKRFLSRLRQAYDEMKLAAIVICQREDPALIDSLTIAL